MMRGDCGLVLMSEEGLLLLLRSSACTGFFILRLSGSSDRSRFMILPSVESKDWSLVSECSVSIVSTVAVDSAEDVRDNRGCDISAVPSPSSDILSGTFPEKLKWELVPVGAGLINAGDMVFKKSRYACGGVMGVLTFSSLLIHAGVPGSGLRISEGYEAETGVCRVDTRGLGLPSLPVATTVEVEEVLAMTRLDNRERRTSDSKRVTLLLRCCCQRRRRRRAISTSLLEPWWG